jgi:hypothetical protein
MPSKKKPLTGPQGGTTTVTSGGKLRVVVYLEPEERRALKVAAAERDSSVSDLVRAALRQYLGGE